LEKLSWKWQDEIAVEVQEIWGHQFESNVDQACWDEVKADIKHAGIFGSGQATSLLHIFVRGGSESAVQLLLYKGKTSDIVRAKEKSTGATALHLATKAGAHAIFRLLLGADADPLEADHNGISSYAMAISGGDERIIKILMEGGYSASVNNSVPAGENIDVPPLMLAVQTENKAILELLLDNQARVDVRDSVGNTPLMKAIADGRSLEIVQLLLSRGANPNAENDAKDTPLILAVKAGSELFVDCLINLNTEAKFEIRNADGETALYIAAKMGLESVVKALLEKGANCVTDYEPGHTPLDVARPDDVGVMGLLQDARRKKMSCVQRYLIRDTLDRKYSKAKSKGKGPIFESPQWSYTQSIGILSTGR
jgi:ankyrin repeat protein